MSDGATRLQLVATNLSSVDVSTAVRIHSGPRHCLYRLTTEAGDIVIKTDASTGSAPHSSLERECDLLRQVESEYVVKTLGLTSIGKGIGLLLASAGDSTLADRIRRGPMPMDHLLTLAVQLADAVSALHQSRIAHLNIQPNNIVWDSASHRATLVDFGSAYMFSEVEIGLHSNRRLLELTYVSPEQTGRTGRSVDSRADLYSLGTVFYELMTGHPPLTGRDEIELIHAHIARRPEPIHEVRPAVPVAVSNIVAKLLEKDPEHRYQTAAGLVADLREAQTRLSQTGVIAAFALASRDVLHELKIPERLYGRDAELATLESAFERIGQGHHELVLISGTPGVGKSALVTQFSRWIARNGGLFVGGKFDQLQRNVPFSGLAQAFQALARRILVEDGSALATWRERIEDAVSPNCRVLIDMVPELGRILGPQPAPSEVGPLEAKNRFVLAVTRFVSVFARREHPLTLFLDDLQWIDPASLDLLGQWMADNSLRHLLLVGAYREGEVDNTHPLKMSMAAWRNVATTLYEIHVGPLGVDDLTQLAADALNSNPEDVRALGAVMLNKTAGNPFFARRLLLFLHTQGLIRFVPEALAWQWDTSEIARTPIAESVVDLMTQAIGYLPAQTQTLLQIGACIGHRFDLATLADASGLSRSDVTRTLQPALADGLLSGRMEVESTRDDAIELPSDVDRVPQSYQFSHDRVQQAAYVMSSASRRRELHVAIGRRMLHSVGDSGLDANLFEIVDQLNLGSSLMQDPVERLQLAKLNLTAGRKAHASAAYKAAGDYLQAAIHLLPDDPWLAQSELTFALHRERAECAYLTGQHEIAEKYVTAALAHAHSRVAKSELYSLRVLAATVVGDWPAALRWGREGLAVFGQAWPLDNLGDANEIEAIAVIQNLEGRPIGRLVDEAEVQDVEIRASMRLLSLLGPPAYFSGAEVLTFLVCRAANLSLRNGPSAYSAFAYVLYGAIHNARTKEYDVGYAFGNLALALVRRFADRAEESRVLEVFSLVVHGWKAHIRESLPLVKEGYRAGVVSGELAYAAFNLNSVLINGLPSGVSLTELLADADVALDFARRHANRTSVEIALPFRQFACSLMGATRSPGSFDDDEFAETAFLEEAKDNATALGNFWVARLQAAYLLGDAESVERSVREGEKHVNAGILGMIPSAEFVFYSALSHVEVAAKAPVDRKHVVRGRIDAQLRQLELWASHCPSNFAHKVALLTAEIARCDDRPWEAAKLYREAIDGAAEHAFVQDEALAHTLRARLFMGIHEPELAIGHFRQARDRYLEWGAVTKARAIELECPECFAFETRHVDRRMSIDALALIKASQAIAAETVPEALFERILRVLVEVAGANRAAVIFCEDDELTVQARIEMASSTSVSVERSPLHACADLPATIIRYVVRKNAPVVLANAAVAGDFAGDPAVRQRKLRSVLCVPLQHRTKITGAIYLENDALAGAFVDGLAEIVEVLAAQAVISYENARLHRVSQQELEHRAQAQRALSEADRRKDEFLAMLAHELRNPLAPIGAAAELLQLSNGDPTRAQKASVIIGRQVKHMTGLIDDLLDVSRVTRGQVKLEEEVVDIYQSVVEAVEQVRPLIESKRHNLELHTSSETMLVQADPKRLLQVLTNLLTNAAKYTPEGGRVTVELSAKDSNVQICVIDTGLGMSAELLTHCFEMFVQAERTSDRAAGGLGIGLALVRSLVELQGGKVQAQSKGPGKGSRFTVTLPLVNQKLDVGTAAPFVTIAPLEAQQRLNVLIVDDNVDAADALSMLIEEVGHKSMVEYHPSQALSRAQHEHPDVCLLDIGLPDIDGYELAQRLRTMLGPRVALIAVTGYGLPQDREAAFAAGFDEHFTKPLELGRLMALLATLQPAA
jgi:predicted ATPase/signal transduction histidine kinase